MVHAGVEGGDVCQAELREGLLENTNASIFRAISRWCVVDGADDFVDVRRNKGI
jgi:hypothetical protein